MKWENNLKRISKGEPAGRCPFCGSEKTNYKATPINRNQGFLDLWCEDCKSWYHASRITINKTFKTEGEVPKDLVYKN